MKLEFDKMISQYCLVDKMSSRWNGKLTKWHVDIFRLMKWPVDIELGLQQVYKMMSQYCLVDKMSSRWNNKWTKWWLNIVMVDKMSSRWNGKLTKWWVNIVWLTKCQVDETTNDDILLFGLQNVK